MVAIERLATLAVILLASLLPSLLATACNGPSPSPAVPTSVGPFAVSLTTNASRHADGGWQLEITLHNDSDETLYLPICGPWQIVNSDNLQIVQAFLCEVDYLGYRIEPQATFVDDMQFELEPGTYRLQATLWGDCNLGEPQVISPRETNYGPFDKCATQQALLSAPFELK